MGDFTGRTALVTGAAGDIGAATAAAFGSAGANLVITDRRGDALGEIAMALHASGVEVLAHACDQTDPLAVTALFDAVRDRFGRLDATFVNAGYGRYGALIDLPFDQWRKHVEVNLNGGFLMAQGAARLMRDGGRGGAIVMNASTAATHVCDMLGAYAASKAGVRMLAKSLASELGVHRIRVNLILPGVIETAMTKGVNYPKGLLAWGDEIGAGSVLATLDALQAEYGEDRYRPSPLLRRTARSGGRLLP